MEFLPLATTIENRPMPTLGRNTSPDNVSRSADYTVSVSTLSGADSVLFCFR